MGSFSGVRSHLNERSIGIKPHKGGYKLWDKRGKWETTVEDLDDAYFIGLKHAMGRAA